jgi:hypothetical protein
MYSILGTFFYLLAIYLWALSAIYTERRNDRAYPWLRRVLVRPGLYPSINWFSFATTAISGVIFGEMIVQYQAYYLIRPITLGYFLGYPLFSWLNHYGLMKYKDQWNWRKLRWETPKLYIGTVAPESIIYDLPEIPGFPEDITIPKLDWGKELDIALASNKPPVIGYDLNEKMAEEVTANWRGWRVENKLPLFRVGDKYDACSGIKGTIVAYEPNGRWAMVDTQSGFELIEIDLVVPAELHDVDLISCGEFNLGTLCINIKGYKYESVIYRVTKDSPHKQSCNLCDHYNEIYTQSDVQYGKLDVIALSAAHWSRMAELIDALE